MKEKEQGKHGDCGGHQFERNNYFYGKLMTVRDFLREQCYFNEKRRLINRAVHGWGVVHGLDVIHHETKPNQWIVEPGMAIDQRGREILVCEEQTLTLDDLKTECDQPGENLVICLEYAECKRESVPLPPIDCCNTIAGEKTEYNRIRDSFKLRLRYESDVEPIEDDRNYCPLRDNKRNEKNESLHEYLCKRLRKKELPHHEQCSVILALLTPVEEEKDQKAAEKGKAPHEDEKPRYTIDLCSKRNLVHGNPRLYDLIHCFHGDLPHIINIGWKDFHGNEKVSWSDFEDILENRLWVQFDKPIESSTLNRHTFLFTVWLRERSGYRMKKNIFSRKILKGDPQKNGIERCKENNNIHGYTIKMDEEWFSEEVSKKGGYSDIEMGVDVEITLRSSHIMGKNGKALDGDFIGSKFPTGNGVQGGDFISWFSVLPRR